MAEPNYRMGPQWRGRHHTYVTQCPWCGAHSTHFQFSTQRQEVIGIKHYSFDLDRACPGVDKMNANPMNQWQKLVQNYRGIASRMADAQAYIRSAEARERKPLATTEAEASLSMEDII